MTTTASMPDPQVIDLDAPAREQRRAPVPPTLESSAVAAGSAWQERLPAAGWALAGVLGLALVWQLFAVRAPGLPTPATSLGALVDLLSRPFADNGPNDKGVGLHLALSLQRVFAGFGLAALIGVPLGLLLGSSRRAWQAINPLVQVLRPVSPLAWFPIWLTVFRDAGRASVFVIFITALWPAVINTAAGTAAVPRDHRNVARVFRFGRMAYLRHVLVPNALPSAITGLRLSMGIAWMVIVAVEMLSGGAGIGFFVWDSYNASNLPAVAAAIALIGAIGLLLDAGFVRLGKLVAVEEIEA